MSWLEVGKAALFSPLYLREVGGIWEELWCVANCVDARAGLPPFRSNLLLPP